MSPWVFIGESELLREVVELLLSLVLGEVIDGLLEVLGDSLVLGDVVVVLPGVVAVVVVVLGDVVVVESLGDVVVVVSDGIVVAFDEGCGCVACVVAVELELSVVDWAKT